jgi:tetratricopeptide (TPR) repeat protein
MPFVAILAAALLAPPVATPGLSVIGGGAARSCFEAAERPGTPRADEIARCDEALAEGSLGRRDLAATRVNRGILLLRRGRIDDAVADFDAAMALLPDEPEVYLNRGSAFLRRAIPDEAITMFTAALDRNTRRPELAYYGRALAQEARGNLRAAYHDYRRASELAPHWRDPQIELRRFRVVGD